MPSRPLWSHDEVSRAGNPVWSIDGMVLQGVRVGLCGLSPLISYNSCMTAAIRLKNLVKTYTARPPVEAVRGLDLEVYTGECFGLLGPNGAGKTTTLEIAEGLLAPTSGEVEVLGRTWEKNDNELRKRLGISLQETRLSDKLTVRETVTLFRSFYTTGLTPDEAVARVGLEEKAHTYIDKLSGGQRQRLAVATALVGDPELLFLDEPTTGLDPQSRRQLWEVIRSLKERGRTVVITTHYMDEAERLCDRVAVIDLGKVIALGTPAELIARVGGENVIDLELDPTTTSRPANDELQKLPTVHSVREEGNHLMLTAGEPHRALPALLDYLRVCGARLMGLTTRTATLEDVFVTLTGRHLRDDGQ
jgi:ABC-2 type transport system ATP-binding protein